MGVVGRDRITWEGSGGSGGVLFNLLSVTTIQATFYSQ